VSITRRLGSFSLSSGTVVITDPGYYEKDVREYGMGELIETCAVGEWQVEVTESVFPGGKRTIPSILLASFDGIPVDSTRQGWKRIDDVGGDTGLIGLSDLSHFHDASLVPSGQKWTYDGGPADPKDLWYSFVCETVRDVSASVIPFGFVVSCDTSMDIDVSVSESKIVAIRLSVSKG
jgi:hypothetical protein